MLAMRGSVLVVDDDESISNVVAEVLRDEGVAVTTLVDGRLSALSAAIARVEPDLVLLDGGDAAGYGRSWEAAAWLHERSRPVPAIMFTGHSDDLAEARLEKSERSQRAAFVAIIAKPFDLQLLIDVVVGAVEDTRVLPEVPLAREQVHGVTAMRV
jgi:CheY-like chemotaxis protein